MDEYDYELTAKINRAARKAGLPESQIPALPFAHTGEIALPDALPDGWYDEADGTGWYGVAAEWEDEEEVRLEHFRLRNNAARTRDATRRGITIVSSIGAVMTLFAGLGWGPALCVMALGVMGGEHLMNVHMK